MSWKKLNEFLKDEAKNLGRGIIKDVTRISDLEEKVKILGKQAVCNALSSTLAYMSQSTTLGDRALMGIVNLTCPKINKTVFFA
jgi:cyanophycinase-like exopeptidase